MPNHHKIDYVEFPCRDFAATKAFFAELFGWTFTDYGPDYAAFAEAGLDGGFYRGDSASSTGNGAMLIVFFSDDLEATKGKVIACGGTVLREIFAFPGGRRFHFAEPSGNEFAVWSDR